MTQTVDANDIKDVQRKGMMVTVRPSKGKDLVLQTVSLDDAGRLEAMLRSSRSQTSQPAKKGGIGRAIRFGCGGLVALVVLIVVIVALANSGSSKSNSTAKNAPAAAGTQGATTAKSANGPKAHLKAGDTAKIGDVNVTFAGARILQPTQISKPQDGNQWVTSAFTVENTTNRPYTLSTLLSVSMLDKDAHKYSVTITGQQTNGSIEGTIPPKDKVAGEVTFEVPVSAAPYVVRYGQPLGSGTADWDVAIQ